MKKKSFEMSKINPKQFRKINNIIWEINDIKSRKTIEKINKINFVLWKNNATDQPLAKLVSIKKKKREREDTNYQVSVFIWKMAKDSKYWGKETNNVKVIKLSRSDRIRKNKKEV